MIGKIEAHREKENVHCEFMEQNCTEYKCCRLQNSVTNTDLFSSSDLQMKNSTVHITKCNLSINSGIPFTLIGSNLTDLYIFPYHGRNQTIRKKCFSEISIENAEWQLMPGGFEDFFSKINSLNITKCGLLTLDKRNFYQFHENLQAVNFSGNLLTFIMADLFVHNEKLKYCDFSENPLMHIAHSYLNREFLRLNGMNIKFENIDCIINVSTSQLDNYEFSENDRNVCFNPAFVFSYANLEFNLKKSPNPIEIQCSADCSCLNNKKAVSNQNETDNDIQVILCNMTVHDPRSIVAVKEKFSYKDESGQFKPITLEFFEKIIEYVPANIANVFENKIQTLKIISCQLTSINELDMGPFGDDIIHADFSYNSIRAIGKNLFRHNRHLRSVRLLGNPIFFVDLNYVLSNFHKKSRNSKSLLFLCGKTM